MACGFASQGVGTLLRTPRGRQQAPRALARVRLMRACVQVHGRAERVRVRGADGADLPMVAVVETPSRCSYGARV